MSSIQYTRSPNGGPGTFLAIPTYRDIAPPFVSSLHRSMCELPHRLDMEVLSENTHVDDGRNRLVRDFLETDCVQLVFLDADVSWQPKDLKALVEHDADIVAGVYPRRGDDEPFPVKPLPGDRWARADGLVEVEGAPTGFMKIRRHVLKAMSRGVPRFRGSDDVFDRPMIPLIFERGLNDVNRVGGDIEFCKRARACGYKVYVDPMMELGHRGTKDYFGCLGRYWRRHVAIPEGLQAIQEGRDTAEDYLSMFGSWDNPYALSHAALLTAVQMARQVKGPILECGAGLSSLCMGAATDQQIVSLETVPMWATRVAKQATKHGLRNVHVRLCDIQEYKRGPWYDQIPKGDFAFVLCDGIENRAVLFDLMADQIQNAPILVDDIERPEWRHEVDEYCAIRGRTLHVLDPGRKGFGLIL